MQFPPLTEGRLIRRYKRFLADIELAQGGLVTAHVPNTGSLLGCVAPGIPVWVSVSDNPKRKYKHTLVLVKPEKCLVCVDTGVPNQVVAQAAQAQAIPELARYKEYVQEVPYGENSRVDLVCRVHQRDMLRRTWVEVKSTTLAEKRVAMFPDAVTKRGRKHLLELQRVVARGEKAVQLFFIQRGDADIFRPADHIDPEYGKELRNAAAAGVILIALQARITKRSISIKRPIPVEL